MNYNHHKLIKSEKQIVSTKDEKTANENLYVHQILSSDKPSDQILTIKKKNGSGMSMKSDTQEVSTIYRLIQSGGDIPAAGLRKDSLQKVEYKSDYTEEKINTVEVVRAFR